MADGSLSGSLLRREEGRGNVDARLLELDLSSLVNGEASLGPCAVALGIFDGVHRGHQAVLQRTTELARRQDLASVVFTFDRSPLEVVRTEAVPPLLMTPFRRVQLLAGRVDRVVVARFTPEFAALEPVQFVRDILIAGLQCRTAVVGYNYSFGRKAAGTVDMLVSLGITNDFGVIVVPPVESPVGPLSSTIIRQQLLQGEVGVAADLLGRPFSLEGKVATGDGRGRQLGYPTANLAWDERLLVPADGVYLTYLHDISHEERRTQLLGPAVTAIGSRPTFAGESRSVESFVLDYKGDLYQRTIEVEFLRRLRGISKFDGPAELRAQIEEDIAQARTYFAARRLQQ